MFCYQRHFDSEVEVIDSIYTLDAIFADDDITKRLLRCRKLLHVKHDKKGYDACKRQLPMFIFQAASFDETNPHEKNKRDVRGKGRWRVQEGVHLNGLCVLDLDHIDDPAKVFIEKIEPWIKKQEEEFMAIWRIMLVYVTPSEEGLKVVFTADPEVGNLADNQIAFSRKLGVKNDKSIKDASRSSFAVTSGNVLHMDSNLLDYNNEEFEAKYGAEYRKGHSAPINEKDDAGSDGPADHAADAGSGSDSDGSDNNAAEGNSYSYSDLKYGKESIEEIVLRYVKRYGTPVEGDRHRTLIKVAGHLRYLVDNNAQKLKVAVRALPWVREWEQKEHNRREIDDIAQSVCDMRMWREIPKDLQTVLQGVHSDADTGVAKVAGNASESVAKDFTRQIWDRLQPLLGDDPLYSLCTAHLGDANRIAGIMVAGGMFTTLATRCYYKHYDGKMHRMNPHVMVIGAPASGKSFANDLDDAIMTVMRAADEPGRRAEAEYKKEQKKRRTSNKAAKGEQQLKEPEACIRYIPSRTSNAVFYRRQQNAKEMVDGEVMPLHLYTFDSELDSTVAAQAGGSWIAKHDLELKAFHNEKSGVDYANADSVNDVITVYYNQVVTGTDVSLAKKINMRNVNDGLCSRIAIVRIDGEDFKMLTFDSEKKLGENYEAMKKWGEFFDSLHGEIVVPKLVKHCYNLCEKAAKAAEQSNDRVLDYFRKRAVFYAEWFTIPRILARAKMQSTKNGKTNIMKPMVKQSDLDFAELIFDTIIYYQDLFFGKMLEEVWENAKSSFVVRRQMRASVNDDMFKTLPDEFTTKDVVKHLSMSYCSANNIAMRWRSKGWVKKTGKGLWKKI